jgi:two-component system, sensor histidine kinase and response regulator
MKNSGLVSFFQQWSDEFRDILEQNEVFYVGLFTTDRTLLYASKLLSKLFAGDPCQSFMNPKFEDLLTADTSRTLIFEGYLTIGDEKKLNTSIWGQVYRKQDELLLIGGVNAEQLVGQNQLLLSLNSEINNLQRTLMREKKALQVALAQLDQANQELREMNASKDRFISILAHDLRTPFNALLGFSDLLLENLHRYDIETIGTQIKVISNTAHQTFELLQQILMWANSQSGKMAIDPERVDFAAMLEVIKYTLSGQASAKRIMLTWNLESGHTVTADPNVLKTVVRNLVSNAIKFTPEGGHIDILLQRNEGEVIITVSDNGVGIKEADIPRMWDISAHYTTAGTHNEKGTGFGLILCKELIERHQGRIWVKSEVGKGVHFHSHCQKYRRDSILRICLPHRRLPVRLSNLLYQALRCQHLHLRSVREDLHHQIVGNKELQPDP